MRRETKLQRLRKLRKAAAFEQANFARISLSSSDPLPKREREVTEFIRRRTRLYLETWVLPLIDELIEVEAERKR